MVGRFDRLLTSLLTISALVIAGSLVHREFKTGRQTALAPRLTPKPDYIPFWKDALPIGISVGSDSARVTILELVDLECPACRSFHRTLREVMAKSGADIQVVFVHYPLTQHRFAVPAARASECANDQHGFRTLVDVVFEKQDSLGLKSWTSYALEAGVKDTIRFQRCVSDRGPIQRVDAGLAFGRRIEITGTPTVIVNGWRMAVTPSATELLKVVEAIRSGRQPFDTSAKPARG